jgi:hypothetical protein
MEFIHRGQFFDSGLAEVSEVTLGVAATFMDYRSKSEELQNE